MTDDESLLHRLTGESTRRSVLKNGALATAGVALAGASSGSAAAQVADQEWDKAIMQAPQFRPNSRFIITSPVIDWNPRIEDIRDNVWSEYNTRVIRYLNTNEQALFWQAHEAEVPDFDQEAGYVVDAEGDTFQNDTPQPEIFRMRQEYSAFGDSGFVTVNFTPVGEDEEDQFFDDDGEFFFDDDDDGQVGLGDDVIDVDGNATNGGNVTDGGNVTTDANATNGG